MDIKLTKGNDCDSISVRRSDGSRVDTTFPKKGLVPHDAIHLVVEKELGYENAFWGRVNDGATPEQVGAIAKAGGHASSKRANTPTAEIVELVRAERIVECFEAEMLGEPSDLETFLGVLDAACAQSLIPSLRLSSSAILNIRRELSQLADNWMRLEVGEAMYLSWA